MSNKKRKPLTTTIPEWLFTKLDERSDNRSATVEQALIAFLEIPENEIPVIRIK